MRAVRWKDHGSLHFEGTSTLVCNAYGDTFEDVVQVIAGSSVSGFVEEGDDWNLGDVLLSRSADVCASFRVNFTVIQMQCGEFSLAVPDEAKSVFG